MLICYHVSFLSPSVWCVCVCVCVNTFLNGLEIVDMLPFIPECISQIHLYNYRAGIKSRKATSLTCRFFPNFNTCPTSILSRKVSSHTLDLCQTCVPLVGTCVSLLKFQTIYLKTQYYHTYTHIYTYLYIQFCFYGCNEISKLTN